MDCLFWRIWAIALVAALLWLGGCILYASMSSVQARRTTVNVNIYSVGGRSISYGEPLPIGARDDLLPIEIKAVDGGRFGIGQVSMFKPALPVQLER